MIPTTASFSTVPDTQQKNEYFFIGTGPPRENPSQYSLPVIGQNKVHYRADEQRKDKGPQNRVV